MRHNNIDRRPGSDIQDDSLDASAEPRPLRFSRPATRHHRAVPREGPADQFTITVAPTFTRE